MTRNKFLKYKTLDIVNISCTSDKSRWMKQFKLLNYDEIIKYFIKLLIYLFFFFFINIIFLNHFRIIISCQIFHNLAWTILSLLGVVCSYCIDYFLDYQKTQVAFYGKQIIKLPRNQLVNSIWWELSISRIINILIFFRYRQL